MEGIKCDQSNTGIVKAEIVLFGRMPVVTSNAILSTSTHYGLVTYLRPVIVLMHF